MDWDGARESRRREREQWRAFRRSNERREEFGLGSLARQRRRDGEKGKLIKRRKPVVAGRFMRVSWDGDFAPCIRACASHCKFQLEDDVTWCTLSDLLLNEGNRKGLLSAHVRLHQVASGIGKSIKFLIMNRSA